jgi:hypothetical protein
MQAHGYNDGSRFVTRRVSLPLFKCIEIATDSARRPPEAKDKDKYLGVFNRARCLLQQVQSYSISCTQLSKKVDRYSKELKKFIASIKSGACDGKIYKTISLFENRLVRIQRICTLLNNMQTAASIPSTKSESFQKIYEVAATVICEGSFRRLPQLALKYMSLTFLTSEVKQRAMLPPKDMRAWRAEAASGSLRLHFF